MNEYSMNDPAENTPARVQQGGFGESASSLLHQVEDLIRRHPVAAALATLGLGCAIGVAAREMLHPPPTTTKDRALQLLEDIQDRLVEIIEPVGDRVSQLAEDGVSAVKSGLHSAAKSGSINRLRNWFS